jgi:methylmalonyl-CoA/ethylmalonyl-CoA epimerase
VIVLKRLDHIAIVVADTDNALEYFCEVLGLPIASTETLNAPRVRLTYLDCGNAFIQLVEPLDGESAIADFLATHGEGLHHICFAVDDVREAVARYSDPDEPPAPLGSGRGKPSAFFQGAPRHGVRIECTQLDDHIVGEAPSDE